MTSKWLWNATSIWVTDQDISREIKRAELFVLDATSSSYQFFGAGSRRYSLKGMVIGDTDRSTLETDAINNQARTLTTPYGTVSNLKIDKTPKFTAKKYASAVVDGTTYNVDTTPIYDYELELITAS